MSGRGTCSTPDCSQTIQSTILALRPYATMSSCGKSRILTTDWFWTIPERSQADCLKIVKTTKVQPFSRVLGNYSKSTPRAWQDPKQADQDHASWTSPVGHDSDIAAVPCPYYCRSCQYHVCRLVEGTMSTARKRGDMFTTRLQHRELESRDGT